MGTILHVEYAERGTEYSILFISSLFCEYIHLEYVCIHAIYRVHRAEYVIHIRVVAPQKYVNIYSTHRGTMLGCWLAIMNRVVLWLLVRAEYADR